MSNREVYPENWDFYNKRPAQSNAVPRNEVPERGLAPVTAQGSVGAAPAQPAVTGTFDTRVWELPENALNRPQQPAGDGQDGLVKRFPTIARLGDLSSSTTHYQGPILIEESVRCWRELQQAADTIAAQQAEIAELRRQLAEANDLHVMQIAAISTAARDCRTQAAACQGEVHRA